MMRNIRQREYNGKKSKIMAKEHRLYPKVLLCF